MLGTGYAYVGAIGMSQGHATASAGRLRMPMCRSRMTQMTRTDIISPHDAWHGQGCVLVVPTTAYLQALSQCLS